MDSSTFIDPAVVSYLEDHFGIVDVDIWSDAPISSIDPSLSGETLNARFRPPGVPAMAILDADGTIIIGVSGYKSSESLLAILGYVTSGSYEDMTLEDYLLFHIPEPAVHVQAGVQRFQETYEIVKTQPRNNI